MENLEAHLLASLTGPLWKKIGIYPHHGINIHLSALHSLDSCGIGEFFDLIPLIDWCHSLKLDVIQLLPLSSSEQDPSPYNAISSCAINFVHLSLQKLPYLELATDEKNKLPALRELSKSQRIAYREVLSQKLLWLHAYFEKTKEALLEEAELQHFISLNPWVTPYALFHALRDHLGNIPWTSWPPELTTPSSEEYPRLLTLYQPKVAFYIVLQYLCYQQLKAVREYASSKKVLLMGDIPILLSPESADLWQYPEYFDINLSAGAPPDAYSQEGQSWGFPLFRWDVMRKNGFAWWKQRLNYASHFFNLYRVDHIVGFFRFWTIPLGNPSHEGYFLPAEESQWESQGRELLHMLSTASPMLPIGEDLGSIPPIVFPILNEFGICGTKVMRWMRSWDTLQEFIPIQEYPPISLTCLSTHDSPTLQQWWAQYPDEAQVLAKQKQWPYLPDLSFEQRRQLLWDSHHTTSLFHINLLQEYLALFPELIWPHPDDERINIPGQMLSTNWTYRFRASVEQIIAHEGLAQEIRSIIE